jgi:hypothetical protein
VSELPPAESDLDHRQPVWDALSSLYLDTDTSLDRAWRADVLARSPYSPEQLEAILTDEVQPVCRWNLHVVAGAWSGFDAAWMEQAILHRRTRPWRFMDRLIRRRVSRLVADEWAATQRELRAVRAELARL